MEHFEVSFTTTLSQLETVLVRTCLGEEAARHYQQGDLPKLLLEPVLRGVEELSSAYIQESLSLPMSRFSEHRLAAYALYYLPVNLVKLAGLFQRSPQLLAQRKIRMLDFGAGPGTALCAFLALSTAEVEYVAVEQSPDMARLLKLLLREISETLGRKLSVTTVSSLREVEGRFDLVTAANSLCELSPLHYSSTAQELLSKTAREGIFFILEPGTKTHGRRLMELRDLLLKDTPAPEVLFPCTHLSGCPMLKGSPHDWCHGTLDGQQAGLSSFRIVAQVDKFTGFNKHRITYSPLVLSQHIATPGGDRVIVPAYKSHRGIEALVCGEGRLKNILLPKSQRSESNRSLLRANQYERIGIEEASGTEKLTKNTKVLILGQ